MYGDTITASVYRRFRNDQLCLAAEVVTIPIEEPQLATCVFAGGTERHSEASGERSPAKCSRQRWEDAV